MNRVLHQEYLEAWLKGEDIQIKTTDVWVDYKVSTCGLSSFICSAYNFRKKPKTMLIDIEKFQTKLRKCSPSFNEERVLEWLSDCAVEEE